MIELRSLPFVILLALVIPISCNGAKKTDGVIFTPPKHVGLYIHGGWLFDYPFAPRTWQRSDYAGMYGLLKRMGYDSVMIWPLLEAIPMPLTPGDTAELQAFKSILQDGHDAGLITWISQCANLTTPSSIGGVPWRQRNPYPVFRTINFSNVKDSADYLLHRRAMMSILNNADGYVTIDGDPGGYEGANPKDFVNIFLQDHATISQFGTNPSQQQVIPWVWSGWGQKAPFAEPIEPFIRAELDLLSVQLQESWAIMPGRVATNSGPGRTNMTLTQAYKLESRSTLMLYEAIEPEPIAPSPDLKFDDIRRMLRDEAALYAKGASVMGNAQQPIMKLPGIYFFSRAARDSSYINKSDDEILTDFANFLGGPPSLLLPAWKCYDLDLYEIPANLPAQLRAAALTGEPSRLIPGGSGLYLDVLAAQVESRRRMLSAMTLPHASDADAAAAIVEQIDAVVGWWSRHHYVIGNDPGTSFSWQFVHPSQYNALTTWVRAEMKNKQAIVPLASQGLVSRGTLSEPTATLVVRQLLGL